MLVCAMYMIMLYLYYFHFQFLTDLLFRITATGPTNNIGAVKEIYFHELLKNIILTVFFINFTWKTMYVPFSDSDCCIRIDFVYAMWSWTSMQ